MAHEYESVNPNNGKLIRTFPILTDAQLEAKLASAVKTFEIWKNRAYSERAIIVAKAAELMLAKVGLLAKLATTEMGKLINEARGEVKFSGAILAYYAEHAEAFLAPVKLAPEFGEAHMESSPMGVIFCVEPWNFPYYQLARVAGPQIMVAVFLSVPSSSRKFGSKPAPRLVCTPIC
jgi:succinate-semialdehyde dehydrogenase/glutarate-semialdehyde dehydrogenase